MPYVPRESMMLIGGYGVGKTMSALSVVSDPNVEFIHYIWSDRPIEKLVHDHYPEYEDQIIDYFVEDFKGVEKALISIKESIVSRDPRRHWIVCDTIGQMYRMLQNDFSWEYHGRTAEQLKLERIKTNTSAAMDGFLSWEWRIIRDRYYNELLWPMLRKFETHLALISHVAPKFVGNIARPDPIQAKDLFNKIGVVPDVHKSTIGFIDTCIYMGIEDNGTHVMQTIKETGKRSKIIEPTSYDDFWTDYRKLVGLTNVK